MPVRVGPHAVVPSVVAGTAALPAAAAPAVHVAGEPVCAEVTVVSLLSLRVLVPLDVVPGAPCTVTSAPAPIVPAVHVLVFKLLLVKGRHLVTKEERDRIEAGEVW